MAAYIDHVGYWVSDLDWYISFFDAVFDMPVERERVNPDGTREVWLTGGLQFLGKPGVDAGNRNAHHLCLITDDLEGAREKALSLGCTPMPKHHWFRLPDGLQIEMFTALPGAVETLKKLPKK